MWMPRADDAAALAHRLQRQRHQIADGRKDDRGIERLRRQLVRSARPGRAEAPGEGLGGHVSRPREGKDRSRPASSRPARRYAPRRRSRRGPAVLPSPAITSERQPIRPAQSSGASATSLPASPSGNAIARIGDRGRRKAAVARVAGEERAIAQIFLAARRNRGRRRRCGRATECRRARPCAAPRRQPRSHRSGRRSRGPG